jgi:hypothetical protein
MIYIEKRTLSAIFLLPLAVVLLISTLDSPLSSQDKPTSLFFNKLEMGDWWLVKVEQKSIWKRAARPSWVDVGEWKFEVRSKESQKLIVDVSNLNRPKDAQRWELTLVYNEIGVVIDATYTIGDRTFTGDSALELIPLGKEGLSIGVSLQKLKKTPITTTMIDVKTGQEIGIAEINFDNVDARQLWHPGEVWWREFNRNKGLPVRGELKLTSWWKIEIDKKVKVKFKEKK